MRERRDLFFLSTKKNPAPKGDVDGQMMPAARESGSGLEMLYRQLVGKGAPVIKSIPHKDSEGVGDQALSLQKTGAKS